MDAFSINIKQIKAKKLAKNKPTFKPKAKR